MNLSRKAHTASSLGKERGDKKGTYAYRKLKVKREFTGQTCCFRVILACKIPNEMRNQQRNTCKERP